MYPRVALLSVVLGGCFFSLPPKVPRIEQPQLAADAFITVETDTKNERRSYTEKIEVCPKGSRSGCVDERRQKHRTVAVNVAHATVDGTPISIGAVAMAASDVFSRDTEQLRGLTARCKQGRIAMTIGGLGMTGSFFLLNVGFADPPNRTYQVAGIATLGAGAVLAALGRFAFGGQHCGEADELYRKWSGVYQDPNDSSVKGDRAELLEALANKFNRDRARAEPAAEAEEP